MAILNHLIMDLLRIITPEEIGEITTRHNGGKFTSLTEIVDEALSKNIYRSVKITKINDPESPTHEAKVLPFKKELSAEEQVEEQSLQDEFDDKPEVNLEIDEEHIKESLNKLAHQMAEKKEESLEHSEADNTSTFILIEKARLKKSQQSLKQKEIMELYKKNISVDIEQIRGQDANPNQSRESGVLVNKKQY